MPARIAVVGAGPKAAALAARCAVLRDRLGAGQVPELTVFEYKGVGAAWDGSGAYSSGFLTLCTPAEKDVGFPYGEQGPGDPLGPMLSSDLFARFSWGAFLVAKDGYADWVDRGRDHPGHRRFAEYLTWVFEQAGQRITHGTVEKIQRDRECWRVRVRPAQLTRSALFHGVVLTGCGTPRYVEGEGDAPGLVFNAKTFWPNRSRFTDPEVQVAVVAGDGGSAGTIAAWLAEHYLESDKRIVSVSPMGTLFPRGDGYAERRWFSDPSDWQSLRVEERKKLIDRTEAGVLSMRIKRVIDASRNIEYQMGKVCKVAINDEADDGPDHRLSIGIEYPDGTRTQLKADLLVNAIGFDRWSLLDLVDHPAAARAIAPGNARRRCVLEKNINPDLSMPSIGTFPPGLHVPALADLAQGPAMSNLGALGLMATKLLAPYIGKGA